MTLKAHVMVNRHQAKVLFDTVTMGDNLIFRRFVSTNRNATENLEAPISFKMAVKRSRYTINYRAKPVSQIGSEPGEITEGLVSSLENYDIFLEMRYLNHHQVCIDHRKATIKFPKTEYVL
jgi:hypothetical protein